MKKLSIHIVGGTGKMGSFLRTFFLQNGIVVTTSGRNLKEKEIKTSNVIFTSVPISHSKDVILEVADLAPIKSSIIDLSSVMSCAQEAFQNIKQDTLSIHFLFNPQGSTMESQTIIKQHKKTNTSIDFILKLFEKNGAKILTMNTQEHDKTMAYIQNLIHFINISLAQTLEQKGILKKEIITPVFLAQLSSIMRVLGQDASLLSEIQKNNPYGTSEIENFLTTANNLLAKVKTLKKENLSLFIQQIQGKILPQKENKQKEEEIKTFIIPKNSKLAYLGPKGTYSYTAALQLRSTSLIPKGSISDVFQAVSDGRIEFAVVPAQNTREGAVRETFDLLAALPVKSITSIYISVSHALLSKHQNAQEITDIYSHPQALGQCREFLQKNFNNARIHETASTLSEIKSKKSEKGSAFIAPINAAGLFKLFVVAKNIQDRADNTTRFFVITAQNKTLDYYSGRTLLFLSVYNRVGILRDILTVFANENINLKNIESRPSSEVSWDYNFFIEVEVPKDSPQLRESLNILRQYCLEIKILGGV